MFAGHLALALAAKPAARPISLGTLVAAAFALDLIWPVFLLAGIERVRIDPASTRFTPLAFDHYPWTHSLAMSALWAAVATMVLLRRHHMRHAAIVGALVISHWVLDFITHRPDLPLWPGGPMLGLGLWNSIAGTFIVEGLLVAAGVIVYERATRANDRVGRFAFWSMLAFTLIVWSFGPFSPPPPSTAAVAIVALALWLFPAWAAWIDRHRNGDNARAGGASTTL